jgi:hypothetical protein
MHSVEQIVNGVKYGSKLQDLEAAHQIELLRPRLSLLVCRQVLDGPRTIRVKENGNTCI